MEKNRKIVWYLVGMLVGVGLAAVGVLLRDAGMKQLTGVCMGVGSGLFGMMAANLITLLIERRHPEEMRAINREKRDERNIAIRNLAGAKTNRAMSIVISVVALTFALMNVDLAATLILCGVVLLQAGVNIYYHSYYNKRM